MAIKKNDIIGPYIIERALSSSGGMSDVYLGHLQERPEYRAALKVASTDSPSQAAFQDLIRRETDVLAKLHHPSIVHIYPMRFGERVLYTARAQTHHEKPWYYAMEYIGGPTLDKMTSKIARKFPLSWAFELFYQLLTTVHYMHRCGYAHCDLKPQNIMFRTEPQPNQLPLPVLVDFGSASPVKQVHELTVTVRYSSPEALLAIDRQDIGLDKGLRGDKIDIWSLGLLLYEIVTGKPLFDQRRKSAITTTILRGQLRKMSDKRRDVHKSLDAVLARMLRRNPSERPTTAQLISAFEQHIETTMPPRVAL